MNIQVIRQLYFCYLLFLTFRIYILFIDYFYTTLKIIIYITRYYSLISFNRPCSTFLMKIKASHRCNFIYIYACKPETRSFLEKNDMTYGWICQQITLFFLRLFLILDITSQLESEILDIRKKYNFIFIPIVYMNNWILVIIKRTVYHHP